MSPEQIDAAGVDSRSDLYCLGLVFYEMLAGKPPFESSSPRELLNLQCTAPPPPLPDGARRSLPKGVERLLLELLEKRPDDRPGSAADVLHELEPFAPASEGAKRKNRAADEAPAASTEPTSGEPSDKTAEPKPKDSESPKREAKKKPERERADTIALVEKAAAPREVPARAALLVVVALSVIAALVTYIARVSTSAETPGEKPATTAERSAP